MQFMTGIITRLNDTSQWFYKIYLNCYTAGWPLDSIASWFYGLSTFFSDLAWYFRDFSQWVSDVSSKIGKYLSWDTIWSYILSYIPNLIQIRDWFYGWVTNVTGVITNWWSATSLTVQGWISAAVGELTALAGVWSNFWNTLWPQLTTAFNSLKSAWDNFWLVTFPNLVSWDWLTTWWNSRLQEVQGLIDTAVRDVAGMAEGWQDMKSDVVTFFQDPVEFIWQRFTSWFLGGE